MTDVSIPVALAYTGSVIEELALGVTELESGVTDVSSDLESLESRAERIRTTLGPHRSGPRLSVADDRPTEEPLEVAWSTVASRAVRILGVEKLTLGDLLGNDRARLIDDVHTGAYRGSVQLDAFDIAAAVTAGALGALVDLLVVRIPTGGIWDGSWQRGSELTFSLRKGAMDQENWLSGLAKVPFDRVTGTGIDGMGPRSHRVQTFGHDPLLGMALGTLDVMRGTLTGVDTSSVVHVVETGGTTTTLFSALALQFGHLLSDVFTHMGLPLPGWTALLTVPFGSFGEQEQTVGQLARWMYLRGYGTWHLVTMASSWR